MKQNISDLETKNADLEKLVQELKHKHHELEIKNENLTKVGFDTFHRKRFRLAPENCNLLYMM